MKRHLIVLFSLLLAMNAAAQEKQLTAQDLIPEAKTPTASCRKARNNSPLSATATSTARATPCSSPGPGRKRAVWLTLDRLNQGLEEAGLKAVKSIPAFSVEERDGTPRLGLWLQSSFLLFNPETARVDYRIPYRKGDTNFAYEPHHKRLAITQGRDLVVIDSDSNRTVVAHDDNEAVSFGASNVHRNEFGISKGIFWSPQGNAVAFYRMDESRVTDYPLVDISARTAALKATKYPMAGMASHEVKGARPPRLGRHRVPAHPRRRKIST